MNRTYIKLVLYLIIIMFSANEIVKGYNYIYSFVPQEERTYSLTDTEIKEIKPLSKLDTINIVLTSLNIMYCVLAIMYCLDSMITENKIKLLKEGL